MMKQNTLVQRDECVRLNPKPLSALTTLPLFLVHSILGDPVQDYTLLVNHLGENVELWGLRSKVCTEPTEDADTIELMASNYLQHIRMIQSRGPYLIGGLSAGGTIAWEMARQLEKSNEQVTLILLDSVSPDIWRHLEGELHTDAVFYLGFFLLPIELRDNTSILQEMRTTITGITNNRHQISTLFDYLKSVVSDAHSARNIQVASRILEAIYTYEPQSIEACVHIYKATEAFIPCDDKMGWFVNNCLTELIPGNHESFLIDPTLIASIRKIVDR
jgi:thioesterase domain-containing protein